MPLLEGAEKLWSLTSLAVPAFVTLLARKAGHRVQDGLYDRWDSAPTTQRLRFDARVSPEEIARRHNRIQHVLGDAVSLPDAAAELADPAGSDLRYADAVRRLRGKMRNHSRLELLNTENRNYGFARNLLGLKPLGAGSAWLSLGVAVVVSVATAVRDGNVMAATLTPLPIVVSLIALVSWRTVDADYVRPSAEAYADAVIEALDMLPDYKDAPDGR